MFRLYNMEISMNKIWLLKIHFKKVSNVEFFILREYRIPSLVLITLVLRYKGRD